MAKPKPILERILNVLGPQVHRTVVNLLAGQFSFSDDGINKAIKSFGESGDFETAYSICLRTGMIDSINDDYERGAAWYQFSLDRSVQIYKLARHILGATEISLYARLEQKVIELHERRIPLFERDLQEAAALALKKGDAEKLVVTYQKIQLLRIAACIGLINGIRPMADSREEEEARIQFIQFLYKMQPILKTTDAYITYEAIKNIENGTSKDFCKSFVEMNPWLADAQRIDMITLMDQTIKEYTIRSREDTVYHRTVGHRKDYQIKKLDKVRDIYENEMQRYCKSGWIHTAALASLASGKEEVAIQIYENSGNLSSAAKLHMRAGRKEKAVGLLEKLVQQCEERKDFSGAADAATRAGMIERAILNHEKASSFELALELASESKMYHLIEGICERSNDIVSTSCLAINLGHTETGFAILEKNRFYLWKAEVALRWPERVDKFYNLFIDELAEDGLLPPSLPKIEGAIQFLEQLNHQNHELSRFSAANLALKAGMKEKARLLFEQEIQEHKDNHPQWAVATALVAGMPEKALDIYRELNMPVQEGYVFRTLGMHKKAESLFSKAIKDHEKRRHYEEAADLAMDLRRAQDAESICKRALEYHEKRKEFEDAANFALRLGLHEKVANYYAREGIFEKAIRTATNAGMYQEAFRWKTLPITYLISNTNDYIP